MWLCVCASEGVWKTVIEYQLQRVLTSIHWMIHASHTHTNYSWIRIPCNFCISCIFMWSLYSHSHTHPRILWDKLTRIDVGNFRASVCVHMKEKCFLEIGFSVFFSQNVLVYVWVCVWESFIFYHYSVFFMLFSSFLFFKHYDCFPLYLVILHCLTFGLHPPHTLTFFWPPIPRCHS